MQDFGAVAAASFPSVTVVGFTSVVDFIWTQMPGVVLSFEGVPRTSLFLFFPFLF